MREDLWPQFWYWVVCSALGLYFGLSVVIAIGGGFDVRKMFRRLKAQHLQDAQQTEDKS